VGGLVLCVCRVCLRRFQREADLMVITGKSKPVPSKAPDDPSRCRSVSQWISCMGEVCDDCLPEPPVAVLRDYIREETERAADRRTEDRSTQPHVGV
jgi:hypothetical protein